MICSTGESKLLDNSDRSGGVKGAGGRRMSEKFEVEGGVL